MDFFDREVRDSFDRMFDRDHDGRLNAHERTFQMEYLDSFDADANEDYDDIDDIDNWEDI